MAYSMLVHGFCFGFDVGGPSAIGYMQAKGSGVTFRGTLQKSVGFSPLPYKTPFVWMFLWIRHRKIYRNVIKRHF